MWYEFARHFIWLLAIFALLVALWRGLLRHRSDSPCFVAYIASAFLQSGGGLVLHHWFYPAYARLYWPSQAVLIALAFAALYEAVGLVLVRHGKISRLGNRLIVGGALVLSVTAMIWLATSEQSSLMSSILSLEQALRLVQVGVLMLAFLFAGFFHLRWTDHA